MISIKEELYEACMEYVRSRKAAAEDAIRGAQLSANEETKSSAGDKYETGRAMAQLEIEKNTIQLSEAMKLMKAMEQVKGIPSFTVRAGSLVLTDQGNFYLAISAGQIKVRDTNYFAISPASPVGQKMMGLTKLETFAFNSKTFNIVDVL